MLENIFQTTVIGSRTVFLNISQIEYFSVYDSLTKEFAEDIAKKHFIMKGKEGTPHIREMEVDPDTNEVKLIVEINGVSNLIT
jgi:hypothetical protein